MIDAPTYALLQGLMRRDGRSLLQYVSEAFPWTTSEERGPLAQLQTIVEEERHSLAAFGRFLTRHQRTPPYLGSYPMDFTTLNFVSLDYLLPLLVEAERRAIVDLERDLNNLGDSEARGIVQEMLAQKRQHLEALQQMADAHRQPNPGERVVLSPG